MAFSYRSRYGYPVPPPPGGRRVGLAVLLILLISGPPAAAQEDPDGEPGKAGSVVNFAFANQLGSGIYRVSGRTVQVYRFAPAYAFRKLEDDGWGLKASLPLTFGFYDYRLADVLETGLPEDVKTYTVVPGLEADIPLRRNWTLSPQLEMGLGRDLTTGQSTFIYSVGAASRVQFELNLWTLSLGNGLVYAGHSGSRAESSDGYAMIQTGIDVLHPLGISLGGHELDYSVFVMNFLYVNDLAFLRFEDDPFLARAQYEIGATFGTRTEARIWKLKIPRLGVSHRFGENLSVIRVVMGTPF